MAEQLGIFDGTKLPNRETPLSWEELIMILSTGYGIYCDGNLESALNQRRNGVDLGDSLALPFGFAYLIRKLERQGAIRRLDPIAETFFRNTQDIPGDDQVNITLYIYLPQLRQPTSNGDRFDVRQHLDSYSLNERDIICQHVTNGVLDYLAGSLFRMPNTAVTLLLTNRNRKSVQDETRYSGIGRVGLGFIPNENLWREIVCFPAPGQYNEIQRQQFIRQALAGLVQCYEHLTEHQSQ